jgi:uncharacterized protein (DUF305 family)
MTPGSRLKSHRLAALVLAAALGTTGCNAAQGDQEQAADATRNPESSLTVLQPGRPGEGAATVDPDEVRVGEREWNHADVAFMQMMIPHHAQALEMSRLASTRAEDEHVQALARRIQGAQGPEIMTMAAWLEARNIDVPKAGEDHSTYDHGAHGHSEMAGMLTEEQMAELEASRGRKFDRLFLQGMISHHRGAVEMAQTAASEGVDIQVAEMSADVATGQAAEIRRMRELLAEL